MTKNEKKEVKSESEEMINGRNLVYFLAIIFAVVIFTTVLYVSLNGLNTFETEMTQAGKLMVAGFNNNNNTITNRGTLNNGTGVFIQGGQYICPACGNTSLPQFSNNGEAHCPACGNVMNVNQFNQGLNQVALPCPNGVLCPPGGTTVAQPCPGGMFCPPVGGGGTGQAVAAP